MVVAKGFFLGRRREVLAGGGGGGGDGGARRGTTGFRTHLPHQPLRFLLQPVTWPRQAEAGQTLLGHHGTGLGKKLPTKLHFSRVNSGPLRNAVVLYVLKVSHVIREPITSL